MGGGNKWHSCVGDIKSHAGFGWIYNGPRPNWWKKWMHPTARLMGEPTRLPPKYNRVGFYKAFLFWQPTVLAATPEVCKFVLSKDSFETGWPESAVALMGRNLFAGLTGGSHMKLRKFTKHAVNNPKALKQYVPLIVNNINALQVDLHIQVSNCPLPLYGKDSSLDGNETFSLYYIVNQGIQALSINFPGTAYNKALKLDDKGEALENAQIIDVLNMYMNAGCRLNTRRAWVALSLMVSVHLLSSDFQVIWHAEGQVHMDPNVHPDPEKFDLECCEVQNSQPFSVTLAGVFH
ncbi:ent-kaurenoic acid oxidase 2 [Selaginella moellendorffii]|uniref:ent-kaurenoic acid oxidase 2 n=1 Tax=Selaginella moellendorffii TaxID=88036 RepID=UPI000D1C8B37|nr:ent-kaurenoic acid oxidase 2 [Selaginella moellendorffii]|eukprot:XP_024523329.1 ent-kaurenoic acid oxidase 2 [Selaginella moellendorffii]